MHTDVRLGRVAGVDIGINWSWLIVVALITWSPAAEVFPETNEGSSGGTYVAMALAATLLYFASLLVHELAHALQARREGMEVRASRSGCSAASPASAAASPRRAPSSGSRSPGRS
jgi:Zn-dependent protease